MSRDLLAWLVRFVTGCRGKGAALPSGPVVYYGNHSSHLDAVVIWASIPRPMRARTRPVAARDYWAATALRRYWATQLLNAMLIERREVTRASNPLGPMLAALEAGDSLILFPEGTRSLEGEVGEFQGGLFHIARQRPHTPMVPVYLENLNRILPKGDLLPLPLIGSALFGPAIFWAEGEPKPTFLERARAALLELQQTS
ncbi:MAG: lysophospholipid acyltransferase family protein [Phycisphaerae bacterium]|nr:lysophospholipid acyltransferase family protein [Phycisphaerae bacterium]